MCSYVGVLGFDAQTGADREVQRILLELLNQMDGFDQTVNVKVRTHAHTYKHIHAHTHTYTHTHAICHTHAHTPHAHALTWSWCACVADGGWRVQVIMATNRADTLDPALLRPGRLDRKIEFPTPDRRQRRLIFQTVTAKMNLSDEVDLEDFVARPEKLSGADIAAVCQEAGMQAVRKNRYVILSKDFEKGFKAQTKKSSIEFEFYQ
jgi:26S proteasome regulatory subunit T3